MMLIVLDREVNLAAYKVPNKLKFKQLLELCQLLCSCGYSDKYKGIKQGKAIQEWIKKNPEWVKTYGILLLNWSRSSVKLKEKTFIDMAQILINTPGNFNLGSTVDTAIFRYSKDYECDIPSNSELDINQAIGQYEKYMVWKGLK